MNYYFVGFEVLSLGNVRGSIFSDITLWSSVNIQALHLFCF
jgi:hypothetical protein